jgi:hypothetical protein
MQDKAKHQLCFIKQTTRRMKNVDAGTYIERRVRRFFVLAFFAILVLIISLTSAKAESHRTPLMKKSTTVYRKQTIQYSKACHLLKVKRNTKSSDKKRELKWR